ncbi:tetratricopeptide repeat protein [Pseudochryseolinea flava]|uniref:Tetratricopeptide repeat protein n=1 Tax=Pseudochryseolinea flava TaxID=2059302 RepID=A0A364Y5W3_9BACT|nr:tetratricopeptide repeat protein [Pseudochryseolinea flava]RAW02222.1 hypothetical protein DQQ10_06680 [Pseudochryseolinea flava]
MLAIKAVEDSFKRIVENAIHEEKINTQLLRMLIIKPNSTFDALHVYHSNHWDADYDYSDYSKIAPLGQIDINDWLKESMLTYESKDVSSDFIAKAADVTEHYGYNVPQLGFDHVLDENFRAYLICRRELLISNITTAIRNAAKFFEGAFTHVVGFILHEMVLYKTGKRDNQLLAFSNVNVTAPFFRVDLFIQKFGSTSPYLGFHEDGFTLIFPTGDLNGMTDDDDAIKSSVYTFSLASLKFINVLENDSDIFFRPNDEFESWKISPDYDESPASKQALREAFNRLAERHPEKALTLDKISHPLHEPDAFAEWIQFFIDHDIKLKDHHEKQIIAFGDDAVNHTLTLIPKAQIKYQNLRKAWIDDHIKSHHFEKAIQAMIADEIFFDTEKTKLLLLYYYVGDYTNFQKHLQNLPEGTEKRNATAIQFLFEIENVKKDITALTNLDEEIEKHITAAKNSLSAELAKAARVKLSLVQDNIQKARELFNTIDLDYYVIPSFLEITFKDFQFAQECLRRYHFRTEQKKTVSDWIDTHALTIPDVEETKTTIHTHPFYFEEAETITLDQRMDAVFPIDEQTCIIKYRDNKIKYCRVTRRAIETLDSYDLNSSKLAYIKFGSNTIYVSLQDRGVLTFTVMNEKFVQGETIGNINARWQYSTIAIQENFLFAENEMCLEIFDLNKSTTKPINANIFIDDATSITPHGDLLIIAGRTTKLIDISNKHEPRLISALKNFHEGHNGHLQLIENFLISSAIIDISNPHKPRFVGAVHERPAPLHNFSREELSSVYATTGDALLKQFDASTQTLKHWLLCRMAGSEYGLSLYRCLGVVYTGATLIAFSEDEIKFLNKVENQQYTAPAINLQEPISKMVFDTLSKLYETHPDFLIGKVILAPPFEHPSTQNDAWPIINIEFHYCNAPFITASVEDKQRSLPIFHASLNLYLYFATEYPDVVYQPGKTRIKFNTAEIFNAIKADQRFQGMAAKHVAFISQQKAEWLHYPHNRWTPFQETHVDDRKTVKEIILSNNENLIEKLKKEIESDPEILDQVLALLPVNNTASAPLPTNDIATFTNRDTSIPLPRKVTYVEGPRYSPSPDEASESIDHHRLHDTALYLLSAHPDRALVKNTILNGARYNIPRPIASTASELSINQRYLNYIARNDHRFFDEFKDDSDVKDFLTHVIATSTIVVQSAQLAYRYGWHDHIALQRYIESVLNFDDFDFYTYRGNHFDYVIDLAALPGESFEPFIHHLLELLDEYQYNDEAHQSVESSAVAVVDMLSKAGHLSIPPKIYARVKKLKGLYEKYDVAALDIDSDDEEHYLLRMVRGYHVRKVISNVHIPGRTPLYETAFDVEPYPASWFNFFTTLWHEGLAYAPSFPKTFIARLCENVSGNEKYNHDRNMAFHFVQYGYKQIIEKPHLAEHIVKVAVAISQHQNLFDAAIDFSKLQEKAKFALLQSAWNDVKEKNLNDAEEKCDALLDLDSNFGQAYFLKARLLWLQHGVEAYLKQHDTFIDKAHHDKAAVARLYNLSGCALDDQKRYNEALPYFEKAALTSPQEAMYLANIAEIHHKMGQAKEAKSYARKAKLLQYDSDMIRKILGE